MPEPASASEEHLREVTVGPLRPHNAPVQLVEYDPNWPKHFAREEQRIRTALGARALRIEHVGSTSVPGLMAKPIIDVLLVVASSSDEASYIPSLEAAGYALRIREPDWHQHRLLKGPDINVNLHVFSSGSGEIVRMLSLRDRLRTDEADRELYARTKQRLAGRTWKFVQDYADAKSEVIEAILLHCSAAVTVNSPPT
ncbi:MAG: GrpB family protein [Thermoplasmata archaeon]